MTARQPKPARRFPQCHLPQSYEEEVKEPSSGQAVEKEIERGNATVAGDDKVGSRVRWWLAGSARYPSNPSGITYLVWRGEGLIFETWMRRFYRTSNAINLVTATKCTAFGVMEYTILVPDLVDCSATAHGVIFAKYVAQITKQQGRYAVGHGLSPLVIRSRGRNRTRCLDARIQRKMRQDDRRLSLNTHCQLTLRPWIARQ